MARRRSSGCREDRFGVVLADLKMPKLDGLALLRELQQRQIPTECIIITGQATVDSAVQAMQQGAYDYIEKPLNAEKLNRLKALIPEGDREVQRPAEESRAHVASSKGSRTTASSPDSRR